MSCLSRDWDIDVYCRLDKKMRQLHNTGHSEPAIKLCFGYDPESSKYAFAKFDDAPDRALKINWNHFDREIKQAVE